jgi:prolyl-tRNA synthetase
MKISRLFTKTSRDLPSDEISKNAQLLIRAGYVHKTMAGVYSYLPLGLKTITKIENIVRKHLDQIGGQEILMNSLHPKSWWEKTDRWDPEKVDVLFRLESQTGSEYALACSHEEQVTPIMQSFVSSYKDLPEYLEVGESTIYPLAVYQIQTKFRDELRSKSGLMRGREFRMKDMYDFHTTQESADAYYELVKETYFKIYNEMGLKAYAVHASGGMFTNNDSHEFQVICDAGEDEILYDEQTGYAINSEIADYMKQKNIQLSANLLTAKSAEVGNIFKLGDKYTKAFDLKIAGQDNTQIMPIMNCHGIGTSRCFGVIAEIFSDEKGLKWPESVAPYKYHLVSHYQDRDELETQEKIKNIAHMIYSGEVKVNLDQNMLIKSNVESYKDEVIWDDRVSAGMGEKLKDAELMGCPYILVISKKSLENGGVELRNRANGEVVMLEIE